MENFTVVVFELILVSLQFWLQIVSSSLEGSVYHNKLLTIIFNKHYFIFTIFCILLIFLLSIFLFFPVLLVGWFGFH